ncbi:MAG TPA: hypothetical protein VET89_04720 [Stellaceae bacterium]|nr:hypothetical protein [Stellaceae bacterium]
MAKTRIIGLAAVGLWAGLAMAGPAAADGLAKFEKTLKPQIPPDTLTYKSAKALGDDGFILEGVVITTPPSDPAKGDKSEPVTIKTITVEDLDFDSIEKNEAPLNAKLRLEGVAVGNNPGGGIDLKQMTGIDKLSADFQLEYKLDTDKETFTLSRLELNLNGLGRLELSMIVDGVSAEAITKPDAAMNDAELRTASVVYDDKSLLGKAVPIAAVMQGSDAKAVIEMAKTTLDAMKEGQSEDSKKAIDSLVAYLQDYEKPKGPLRITLNPPDKASMASLEKAKTADEIVKALGLTVNYPGKRS